MNIFVLSLSVIECALFHCDQHVIKMILESAQLLCSVVLMSGGKAGYRIVLPKHKCTLWSLSSLSNWRWLRDLAYALNDEFKYRYNRLEDHQSIEIIKELEEPNIPDLGMTDFHLAMPEQFKDPDPVIAYRNYYAGAKFEFATWKKREIPQWYVSLRTLLGGDAINEARMLNDPEFLKEKRRKAKQEKIRKNERKEQAQKKKIEKIKSLKKKVKKNEETLGNEEKDFKEILVDSGLKNCERKNEEVNFFQEEVGVKTRRMIRESLSK
jgi:hypothetical protein